MSTNATFGFRTLTGFGSRLVRGTSIGPSGVEEADDWVNYMVKEGTSGWKKGLSFERTYAYQPATSTRNAHHLYRMIVTRQNGLEVLCVVFGRTSHQSWLNAYAALHTKGLMPDDAFEALMEAQAA